MDKKDIYEHLASIYLDASSKKRRKTKKHKGVWSPVVIAVAVAVVGIGVATYARFNAAVSPLHTETALILVNDAAKLNFHFDPAKKEVYSIGLNKLPLSAYKKLGFTIKKANFRDTISLRVEFANSFRETASIYLKDIPHRWKEYRIPFSEFKTLSDWSEMAALSFTVEEWNTREKRGIVYIDNVRVIK